jgi:hypothetical protein
VIFSDILTSFKCGFCSVEYSNPADVQDHIKATHRLDVPSTSSKKVEIKSKPSISILTDRQKLSELLTRLDNFDWCSCKVCVAYCRMFFEHAISTHSDGTTNDTSEIAEQECFNYLMCEAKVDLENVHNANSSNGMKIDPAPNRLLDDHCYSAPSVTDEPIFKINPEQADDETFKSDDDINLPLAEQLIAKKSKIIRKGDRSKRNVPGMFRRMKFGKTVRYVFNNDINRMNPEQSQSEKIPPLPNLVQRKINTIMKSESKEKIMEYQCALCGNIYYRKDVILKCLAAHRTNGWMDYDMAAGEEDVEVSAH